MRPNTIDLAVVTSAWGDYAKYLPRWAESVIAQTIYPTETVIVDAGVRDRAPLEDARNRLEDSGIPVTIHQISFETIGGARNAATEQTSAEWIIHLDADDQLMPWALEDVASLAANADVISLGAMRDGQVYCYPEVTAEKLLARQHGVFSCGAFRRSFWARRPWHTHNDWSDSTFWVGLAHLGARFKGTTRVGFLYVQHSDSVSHRITADERAMARAQWRRACTDWTLT